MSQPLLPRAGAGAAFMLACMLSALPVSAQEGTGATGQIQNPAPAGDVAVPAENAPLAAPAGNAPVATAADSPAPDAAVVPPVSGDANAAADAAAPATADAASPAAGEPVPVPVETVPSDAVVANEPTSAAEAETTSILPEVIREALEPLAPQERDPNLPHDLSPMGMFWAADWVVKAVMIGLAFASIVTWTVLVAKVLELAGATGRAQSGIRRIEDAPSLSAALSASGRRRDPVSRMITAAAREYDRSAAALDMAGDTGLKERVDSHLDRIEAAAGRRMGRGTGVLATIGSTAPFVGLFGTVWGIMNSFIGISESQTTNLAVVAPGIAEALLATAIGLVAAIPAVVIYNVFARAITGYRLRLANAAAGVKRLVSRDLDFRGTTQIGG